MALKIAAHYSTLISEARAAEAAGDNTAAAALYEQAIRQEPVEELPYTRLMIIYRKERDWAQELKVINKGLKVFMAEHDKKLQKYSGRNRVGQLSKALLKSVAGSSTAVRYPGPVERWVKRKETVEKKLQK